MGGILLFWAGLLALVSGASGLSRASRAQAAARWRSCGSDWPPASKLDEYEKTRKLIQG